nr:putative zinc finger, CCHC-type, retrotransposon Gag domain protein [Tanacetum cinerariifolium]
ELTALCTSLQRQHTELVSKFVAQELEINKLKAKIKLLEDKYRGVTEQSRDDAPIKGRRLDEREEAAKRVIFVGNKMHKAFPLPGESSHWQYKFPLPVEGVPTARRMEIPLPGVCTAMMKKLPQREFYTSALRNQAGWKVKHFKGMTLKEIKEKFDPVWKQIQDFIPIGSKEEAERFKRKEKVKEMMQLVPVEEVYVEALQVKHPIIDWKVHTEGQRSYWKIIRLGGSSVSYQFFVDMLKHFDREDLNQLWGLVKETLSIRPATSDKEMELWLEHQVQERIVRNKMHKAFPLPVKTSHCQKKFPLLVKKVPPAEEKRCHCCEVSTATKVKESNYNCNIMYKDSLSYKGSPLVIVEIIESSENLEISCIHSFKIIMANVIPPDHVDDLPVVESNQPDAISVIPEPILVDENEDPEEEEFEEEEEPQEEEDMDIDDEEDENEPKLTFPYKEADPFNSPPPASDSEPEDVIEVEDTVEPEDETTPASVHETTHALVKKKGKAKDEYYVKLILELDNEVRSSIGEGAAAMENLVRKLGNAKERAECKKLKKELKEAWGFLFEERPNEAINVPVEDEESPSFKPRGSPQSVDAAIAVERARQANAGNNASGSGKSRGQVTAPVVRECTFVGFMKCNPNNLCGTEGAIELRRWFKKTEITFEKSEYVEDKKVMFAAATLRGPALTWWNSKVVTLGLDFANQMG